MRTLFCREILIAGLTGTLLICGTLPRAPAQTSSLSQIKKIYVEPLGRGKLGEAFRHRLIARLRKQGQFEIVQAPEKAQAVLSGTGEIWVTGHVSLSPRTPSTLQQTVYSGFLSARLTSNDKQVLWSYLATPRAVEWGGIVHDLADTLAAKLIDAWREKNEGSSAASSSGLMATPIHGAGATFPAPIYQKWFQSFEEQRPGEQITYDATGSEAGIQQLTDGKVDFAASEIPLSDERMAQLGIKLQHYASVLGAVVPIYNLPGIAHPLNFSPDVLAEIYLGKITRWNDPKIRAVNRSISLPDREIVVIHRSDGSGTTFVWSDFLSKVSPEWKDRVGAGSQLNWPVGTGAEHNEGVALRVREIANSIGYVEMVFALQHQLSYGSVRNASGTFVRANLTSITAAASSASEQMTSDFRISITNAPGAGAYPIASFTWLLVPEKSPDAQRKAALDQLLEWILTSGQKECSELGYAPLPRNVASRELDALRSQRQ